MELNQDQMSDLASELYGPPANDQGPDYNEAINAKIESEKSQLQSSMFVASQRDPDQFGRANKIAQKYGVAPGFVAENKDEFEKKEKINGVDYDGLIKSNPKLAEFLKDPDNATIAQDDIDNLKGLSKSLDDHSMMNELGNAALSGLARMNSSLAKVPAFIYDAAALPQNMLYSAFGSDRRVQSPEWARDNAITKRYDDASQAYADQAPSLNQSAIDEISAGNFSRAGKIIALQVVNNAPQQVANIGLAFVNPLAGAGLAFGTTAAEKNAENAKNGVDPITGTLNATLQGTIEAGFESIGTFGLLDRWGAQLAKTYGEATTKEILKETGKALAATFAGEANEEALTSIAQGFADKHMGISPDLTYTDIFKDAANSGLVGGFSGFSTTGPAAIADGALGIRARVARNQDLDFYKKLGEFAETSKLKERAPEKYQALVGQLTEGTPVERVYMPVEGVEEYFQSKGINPVQFMNEAGLTKEYEAAKLTGGNIELPLSTWVDKVGKSEHFRGLENNVKFNQDALTKNEEIREQGKLKRLFQQAEEEAQARLNDPVYKAEQEKIETELTQVRQKISEQLQATGKYTPELIKDQVELIARPLRYFAAANNKSPMEFLNEINLNIKDGGDYKTPIQRQDQIVADDIDKALGFDINEMIDAPQGIPVFDNAGNRIYDPNVMEHLRQSIDRGEAGKRGVKTSDTGEVIGATGQESTFPDFFKNKGYTKKETLAILDKHLAGETLTEKQQAILNDLYDGALDKTNRNEFFQRGDWKKEGYVIELSETPMFDDDGNEVDIGPITPDNIVNVPSGTRFSIVAYDKSGNYVGEAKFFINEGELTPDDYDGTSAVNVKKEHRRKGIANEMYRLAEESTGMKIQRSDLQTEEGKLLWEGTGGEFFQSKKDQFIVRQDMPKQVKIVPLQNEEITFEQAKEQLLGDKGEVTAKVASGSNIKITDVVFGESDAHVGGNAKSSFLSMNLTEDEKNASAIVAKNLDKIIPEMVFDKREANRKSDKKSDVLDYRKFHGIVNIDGENYAVMLKTERSKDRTKGEVAYIEYAVKLETPSLLNEQAEMGFNASPDMGTSPTTGNMDITINDFAQIINNIREGRGLFQDETNPRARVIFDKYGISVDLFKGSDPTSLMHEMGHVYLEMFKKTYQAESAPEWLKQDAEKVLKYLGLESFDQLQTEHHEVWARSIEKYLYEGKAPNDELIGSFARLKMWFRKVYTDVKAALGVELSDEIREVMDRVFVGDQLVFDANKQYTPLITDAVVRTLPADKQDQFKALLEKYKAKATQSVTEKLMEQHNKDRRQWWKKETEKVQAIFREDLAKRREYVAQNYIKAGELPGQEKATDERAHKLSRESLKEVFGKVPAWVTRSMTHKEGADVRFISDILGFPNVQAFNEEMANTEDIDVVAKRMADEHMKKEYGDVMSDQTKLREMVENAVHNDKKAQILRKELEFLASEDLPALKGLIRKIARRPPKDEIIKARAERIISEKEIGQIQPFIYQRAEAKAAGEAADFFARGDFEKAFDAKQRELLNFYLYREAVRAKELVEEKIQWSKKVFEGSASDVAEKRDWSMVSLARVLLGEYGVTTRDIKSVYEYLDQLSTYDEDSYEALKPLVNKWLIDKKDYKKMSVQDFSEFFVDIEALWSLSKSSRELEINGVKHDIEEVSGKLKDRLVQITSKPYAPGENKAVTTAERSLDKFMSLKSSTQRMESWVDIVDAGDDSKLFETFLLNPVREKITTYRLKKTEIIQKYKELVEKLPKQSIDHKDILASEINYTFKDKAELLAALLHTGNDSNLFKLLAGRKWGDVDEQTGAVDPSRWNRFIDRMHRDNVITKTDWDFIQGVWDLNESIKPDAQKAHKEMYGHFFNEVTHKKFITPFGEYRGGYMPAVTDSFLVEDSRIRQEQDALLNNNNSFMFPTTGRGFTKSRVERYSAPLLLDMNMVAGHFDKVLRFTYIEPTIKKVAKINNKKDYRAVLRQYDPYAGTNLINPWLQRSAQQRVVQPSQSATYQKFDGVAKFLRSSAGLQILGLNLSNAMQQLTGTIVASSKVNPKYLIKAIGNYTLEPSVTKREIMEMSPWMRTRLGEGSMKLTDDINQILFNPSKFEKVADYAKQNGLVLSEMFQHVVDITVWQGAYAEALDQGMTKEQAILRADKEVRLTQGSANAEDISSIEEGTHWSRLFTQFYGYFNMQANLIGSETAKKVRTAGWKSALPTLLPFYLSSYLLPGLAAQAIAQMMSGQKWDSDDDGEIIDDLAWMTLNSTYKGIFAFVPMVGQFANMMIGQFTNQKYDDRLSLSPAVQQLENIGRTAFVGYKAMSGEDLKGYEIKSMLSTLGFMTGLPVGPLGKPVGYIMDVQEGRAEPSGPIDFARGLATGKDSQK